MNLVRLLVERNGLIDEVVVYDKCGEIQSMPVEHIVKTIERSDRSTQEHIVNLLSKIERTDDLLNHIKHLAKSMPTHKVI